MSKNRKRTNKHQSGTSSGQGRNALAAKAVASRKHPRGAHGGQQGWWAELEGQGLTGAGVLAQVTAVAPALALLAMVGMAFASAFSAGFVWDDSTFVVGERHLQSLAGLLDIWTKPGTTEEFHYWPVLYTSFWLDSMLWGFAKPVGFHLTNVVLHGCNAVLLWRVLLRLNVPGAWLIAAVFAVHPLRAEAVVWVIARKDLLATLFYLLAMSCWLMVRERGGYNKHGANASPLSSYRQQGKNPAAQVLWYLLLSGTFAAGILSKSVVLTLPIALVVVLWWQQGRVHFTSLVLVAVYAAGLWGASPGDEWAWLVPLAALVIVLASVLWWHQQRPEKYDLIQLAPLFIIGLGLGSYDLQVFNARAVHEFDYSMPERLIMAAKASWFYVEKMLWPTPLLFHYPYWELSPTRLLNWVPMLAALATLAVLTASQRWLGRGPLAGVLFFAITIAPVLGLIDFGYMKFSFAADRYTYLPGIGLTAVLVGMGTVGYQRLLAWLARGPAGETEQRAAQQAEKFGGDPSNTATTNPAVQLVRLLAAGLMALLLASYGLQSYERGKVYENDVTLFAHVTATNPEAAEVWFNYGTVLLAAERHEDAVVAFREAADRTPAVAKIYINLGSTLMQLDRYEEAEAALRQAIELEPQDFSAVATPLRARNEAATAHINLSNALLKLNRPDEAEAALRQALAVDPGRVEARQRLPGILMAQAHYEEALIMLRELIQSNPELATMAYYQMGEAATALGRTAEADRYYQQALAQEASDVTTLFQQAAVHFQAGRYEQALALYQQGVTMAPNNPESHANLGAALGSLGRYEEAVASFTRALQLDPELESARAGLEQAEQLLNQNR